MGGFLPSRRRFLGGAGVVVGLPFLESALPRQAWGQPAPVVKRFLPCFIPNGVDKRGWPTVADGASWHQKPITAPLAPVKDLVTVLDAVGNPAGAGLHEKATRSFLTSQVTPGGDTNEGGGISVDQAVADLVGNQTRIASLQLGVEPDSYRYVSWRSARQGLPAVADPAQVWNTVFQGFSSNVSQAEVERRKRYETSVLDYVQGELASLKTRLGRSDAVTLDSYASHLRELERRVSTATSFAACNVPAKPATGMTQDKKYALMQDLAVAAFACDATRVAVFFPSMTNASMPWLGIPQGHHDLSHWGADVSKRDLVQKIDVWEMGQFANLVKAMAAIDDGGGRTLLDNSLVYVSSEINEGDAHGGNDLPFVMAGTLGGAFPNTGGRFIKLRGPTGGAFNYDGRVPQSWIFVSVINAFGGNVTKFGADSPGDVVKMGLLA